MPRHSGTFKAAMYIMMAIVIIAAAVQFGMAIWVMVDGFGG
jgi:hypothetical protein